MVPLVRRLISLITWITVVLLICVHLGLVTSVNSLPEEVEIQLSSIGCANSTDCDCQNAGKFLYAICYQGHCACSIRPDPHTACIDHLICSCLHGIPICHEGYCYCLPDYIVLEENKQSIGL